MVDMGKAAILTEIQPIQPFDSFTYLFDFHYCTHYPQPTDAVMLDRTGIKAFDKYSGQTVKCLVHLSSH